jgi:hypothetical protein
MIYYADPKKQQVVHREFELVLFGDLLKVVPSLPTEETPNVGVTLAAIWTIPKSPFLWVGLPDCPSHGR